MSLFQLRNFKIQKTYKIANCQTMEGIISKDKLFTGKATVTMINGDIYQGHIKDNLFHGQGKLQTKKLTYTGSFKNGYFDGKGVIQYCNGDNFVGYFQNGKKKGQGQYISKNGQQYIGNFSNNQFVQGQVIISPSIKLNGKFQNNKLVQGTYETNNYTFEGTFNNNSPVQGLLYIKQTKQSIEINQFINNQPTGQLTFNLLNDEKLFADIKNNKIFHIKYDSNNKIIDSDFQNNKLNGNCQIDFKNQDIHFSGQMVNNSINGYCQLELNNDIYKMNIKNSNIEGKLQCNYKNNDQLVCQYQNTQKQGTCQYTFNNGDTFIADYDKDELLISQHIFSDGSKYEGGTDDDGNFYGQGKYTFSAKNQRISTSGIFFDGLLNYATINYNGLHQYIGEVTDEMQRSGTGELFFNDKQHYSGEFQNDIIDGEGIYTAMTSNKKSIKVSGIFENGKFQEGEIEFPNGDKYNGIIKNQRREFNGTYIFRNNDQLVGVFHKDQCQIGEYTYNNGQIIYTGKFNSEGYLQGEGEIYDRKEKIRISGIFNKNQLFSIKSVTKKEKPLKCTLVDQTLKFTE